MGEHGRKGRAPALHPHKERRFGLRRGGVGEEARSGRQTG